MRKVHLISVSEPLMLDLALAIREKGYEVTVSTEVLTESTRTKLQRAKCKCYGEGWFPEKLTNHINFVVLGAEVRSDNPELVKAKELGLLIQSVPEFIFHRTKEKTRVVVAGAQGKKSIISMIAYALEKQKLKFDYALTSEISVLANRVQMSYESRIALIEGDAQVTSELEKRVQLEFYRPHIALLTNLSWSITTGPATPEEYYRIYKSFTASIEREGKLVYFTGDPLVARLAEGVREDVTAIPYDEHVVVEKEQITYLQTRYGEFPVHIPDAYFLLNLNAARLVCRQLGVKDADFYRSMSEYSLSFSV
ncbi:MAG: UDP-N-acetylmuramate--alanine ligase [Tannerellaceae bacterium]|nr:UDP-N-acetylmuramate--alanine ligase [Tannerellaceae bacterium]